MSDNWFVNHRQDWIAESVRVYGFINREHLEKKFRISTPQASADLSLFQKNNPGALEYDKSSKKFARASEMARVREMAVSYSEIIEALQAVCDEFGCLGGEHRINWIRSRLGRLRELEADAMIASRSGEG